MQDVTLLHGQIISPAGVFDLWLLPLSLFMHSEAQGVRSAWSMLRSSECPPLLLSPACGSGLLKEACPAVTPLTERERKGDWKCSSICVCVCMERGLNARGENKSAARKKWKQHMRDWKWKWDRDGIRWGQKEKPWRKVTEKECVMQSTETIGENKVKKKRGAKLR